jgi:AcrR family transcriptional regulator
MAKTGRRPGQSGSRERILDAARHLFAERGYDGSSIRQIAADAGTDPALVHHYFGTKERLFVAAVRIPIDPRRIPALLADGPSSEAGVRIATMFFALWEDRDQRRALMGVLRSAVSDPGAAALIREIVIEQMLGPIVSRLDVADPELRITLLASQIVGLAVTRYIVAVEPLASLPPERLIPALAPTFQRYLDGPID